MRKYLEWIEPLWGKDGEIHGNTWIRALPEEVKLWWYESHKEQYLRIGKTAPDESVLDDFIVTNWAYYKEY